jgi:hypothetical protein
MDLDYIQKHTFQEGGGSCGIPFVTGDLITSLAGQMGDGSQMGGGGNVLYLVIPGGLVYRAFEMIDLNTNIEIDPWKVDIKEDFDSLIDLVSLNPIKKNKTEKKRLKK